MSSLVRLALAPATVLLAALPAQAQRPAVDSMASQRVMAPPAAPPGRPLRSVMTAFIDSLRQPEAVIYDPKQDVWFISNIDGKPLDKDGKGSIARVRGDGMIIARQWIVSGINDVMLNAPKGMAIQDTVLWVTDIDMVRAFDARTGRPMLSASVGPLGALFLNDIAAGPDGSLYVTDTRVAPGPMGILMPDGPGRIYRVTGDGIPTLAFESPRLGQPNGITWDPTGRRFLIVPMGNDTIVSWRPGSKTVNTVATGPGSFDGVTGAGSAGILLTSKATGALHRLSGTRLGTLIPHLGDVADIGFAPRHGTLGIAITGANRVVFYRVASPTATARR